VTTAETKRLAELQARAAMCGWAVLPCSGASGSSAIALGQASRLRVVADLDAAEQVLGLIEQHHAAAQGLAAAGSAS
jgi:hypothetical protein